MKTFSNLYVVVRTEIESYTLCYVKPYIMGVFRTHDAADSFAGAEHQRMIDKGYRPEKYQYKVELGTYYDD